MAEMQVQVEASVVSRQIIRADGIVPVAALQQSLVHQHSCTANQTELLIKLLCCILGPQHTIQVLRPRTGKPTRISYQKLGSKFCTPDAQETGTRMHDTRAKFLVRDSGTSSWAENLGRMPRALGGPPSTELHYILPSCLSVRPSSHIKTSGQDQTSTDKLYGHNYGAFIGATHAQETCTRNLMLS